MPLSFREIDILHGLWGGRSCPQAGLPAGWTRWKAGPQAEKPAPQAAKREVIFAWALTAKTRASSSFEAPSPPKRSPTLVRRQESPKDS